MKTLTIAEALAFALTLGAGVGLAQPAPHVVDGKNTTTPHPQYNVGRGSAHIGQSWKPAPYSYDIGGGSAKQPRGEGSYSIGSGSARKSGGNN